MKKSDRDGEIEQNSAQWSKKVVKLILQAALLLWWFCTKKCHGNNQEEEAATRQQKALQKCQELSRRTSRLTKHKNIFVSGEKL